MNDATVERSRSEDPALTDARRAHAKRAAWLVGAGVIASFSLMSLAVAIAVLVAVSPGVIGTVASLGAAAVPFVFAILALQRARALRAERDTALDPAWASVASDVLAHKGDALTASELAKTMRIDEATAERTLAKLSVDDIVRTRVTDQGDLAYAVPPDKVRVSTEAEEEEALAQADEAAERARAQIDNDAK